MKKIPLTQGQEAIVDDADFDWLSQWKWHANWYPHTKSFYAAHSAVDAEGKHYTIIMSRLILGLEYRDRRQADHVNHNTLDNRRANLRIVTQQQNEFNRKSPVGYSWDRRRKKFRARIGVDGRDVSLGSFELPEPARQAYLNAKEKYHQI